MRDQTLIRQRWRAVLAAALVSVLGFSLFAASPAFAYRNASVGDYKQKYTQAGTADAVATWNGNNGHIKADSDYGSMGANQGVGPAAAQFEGFDGNLYTSTGYFTDAAGCSRTEPQSLCADRGQITVTFDRPVTDPLLNVAGLGEGASFPSGSTTVLSTVLDIATPDVTFAGVSEAASNLEIIDGTRLQTATNRPSANCTATVGAAYDGNAGCGSVKLVGTFSSVTFDVSLKLDTDISKTGNYTTSHTDKIYMNVTLQDQPVPVAHPITVTGRYSEPFPAQNIADFVELANDPATGQPIPLDLSTIKFSLNGTSGWNASLNVTSGTIGNDAQGAFRASEQGDLMFAPTDGYVGTRTVHYQVSDEVGTTVTGQFTVNVTGPPFECSGKIYSIGYDAISAMDIASFTSVEDSIPYSESLMLPGFGNGLGISNDGMFAYWTTSEHMYKYSADTVPAIERFPRPGTIMGGVNPITDLYYDGNGTASSALYAFDPVTKKSFQAGTFPSNMWDGNGDLAFTASGDLAVLKSGTVTLFPADVVSAVPSKKTLTNGIVIGNNFSGGDGIAYGSDGLLYTDASGKITQSNPNTGEKLGSWNVGPTGWSDLASCSSPGTVKVQKHVEKRVNPGDQYTLKLQAEGATPQTVTTKGNKDGLQDDSVTARVTTAGPVFGVGGVKYSISESGAAGANLDHYNSRYECVDAAHDNEPIASGSGASFELTYPSGQGREVVCTFYNKPAGAEIDLTKVDKSDHDVKLGGAKFQLWKDVNGNGTLEPAVDTKVGDVQSSDKSGRIAWSEGLTAGEYLLEEVEAPAGYDVAKSVTAVTVGADSVTVVVENARKLGSVTWSKTDNAGNPLAGSEWTIDGPSGAEPQERSVKDCVGDAPEDCAGLVDQDPRPGHFKVTKLGWGDYTLTEKAAPAGYVLSSEAHDFTVAAPDGLDIDLGEFVNQQQPALTIPLTGGLGSDYFLLAGGGLAALLLAAMVLRRSRNRSALQLG